jgi:pSer/pThr/pTyr-binding forkhead associated (FHA) protein
MLGSFKADKCWAVLVPLCFDLPTGYLRNHPFTIGRHLQCDLVIAELQVSRKHASISFKTYNRGSEFVIVCHSKNCLFLNQQRVADSKSRMLNDGDEIWLSKGREGPRHRPIGFLFRVGDADTETTLFTKYEGELNLL